MTPEAATLTLAAFLAARLDEDEAAASNPSRAHFVSTAGGFEEHDCVDLDETYLVADPARVLADVAARRAIVALHTVLPVRSLPGGRLADGCCTQCTAWGEYGGPTPDGEPNPCDTLRHLAAVYSDAPDYDERWAVS